MPMRTSPTRTVLLGGVVSSGLATFAGLALGPLEVRGDRFGLGPAAARTAAALVVAVTRGLGATLGAVGHLAFLAFLALLARRRLAARLGDRVGDGAGDQLHRADGVVVAGDRHGDQVRIGVGVDDRDDRDAELVRFGDGDLLLLRVDDEHEARGARERPDTVEVLGQLLLLTRHHQTLLLRVVRPLTALG